MHSTQHLMRCLIQKQKYKQTAQYLKELQSQNQNVFEYINDALYNILSSTTNPPTSKLFALRFFKDIFMTAQFDFIDGLNDAIFKQIVKAAQFDKDNKDNMKRGSKYFQQVQKRKIQNDLEKVSYSYVLFATEIVYVMGSWYEIDQNDKKTPYFLIYKKLKKSNVPFPVNDKELKFFKPEQKQIFTKNLKEWIAKLPQIEEESEIQQVEKYKIQNKNIQEIKIAQQIKQKAQIPLSERNLNSLKSTVVQKSSQKIYLKDDVKENIKLLQQNQQLKLQNSKFKTQLNNNNLKLFQLEQIIKQFQKQENKQLDKITELKEIKEKHQFLKIENQKLKVCLTEKQRLLEKNINENNINQNQLKKRLIQCQKALERIQIQQKMLKGQLDSRLNQFKENKKKLSQFDKQIKEQLPTHLLGYDVKPEIKSQKTIYELQIESLQKQNTQIKLLIDASKLQQIKLKSKIQSLCLDKQNLNLKNKQLQNQIDKYRQRIKQFQSQKLVQVQKTEQKNSIVIKKQNIHNESSQCLQKKKIIQKQQQPKAVIIQNNCKSYESITFQVHKESSMSNYLKLRESNFNQFNPQQSLRNNFFEQNHDIKHSKFKEFIQNTKDDIQKSKSNIKIKKNSLGKTQCSNQKLKNRRQLVQSSERFYHNARNQVETNSKNMPQQIKSSTFHKKAQTSSYSNLLSQNGYKTTPIYYLAKKSSILHLGFRDSQQNHKISTVIPEIKNYFEFKSDYMTNKDNFIFRSLCLKQFKRKDCPIFMDNFIKVKLITHKNKDTFTLKINNIGLNVLKLKAFSNHEEFNILGDKNRYIQPEMGVEYRLQTKVKDLNLRYPIITFMVQEQNKFKNSIIHTTYNIPLPLTILEFTQFDNQMPETFVSQNYQYTNYRSEYFYLNPKHQSLMKCFKNLKFQHKALTSSIQTAMISRNMQLSWQGTVRHSFISNVEVLMKLSEINNRVLIEFSFRQLDKISENYAKVMIQVLMFLLQ